MDSMLGYRTERFKGLRPRSRPDRRCRQLPARPSHRPADGVGRVHPLPERQKCPQPERRTAFHPPLRTDARQPQLRLPRSGVGRHTGLPLRRAAPLLRRVLFQTVHRKPPAPAHHNRHATGRDRQPACGNPDDPDGRLTLPPLTTRCDRTSPYPNSAAHGQPKDRIAFLCSLHSPPWSRRPPPPYKGQKEIKTEGLSRMPWM